MEASELIERLGKATVADRNLDAALHVALVKPEQRADDLRYFRVPSANMDHMEMCAPGTYWLKERSGASLQTAPAYTASLDAALALVERVRPGCDIDLEIRELMTDGTVKRVTDATIYGRAYSDEADAKAYANSPPLALCLALLKAVPNCPPQERAEQQTQPKE